MGHDRRCAPGLRAAGEPVAGAAGRRSANGPHTRAGRAGHRAALTARPWTSWQRTGRPAALPAMRSRVARLGTAGSAGRDRLRGAVADRGDRGADLVPGRRRPRHRRPGAAGRARHRLPGSLERLRLWRGGTQLPDRLPAVLRGAAPVLVRSASARSRSSDCGSRCSSRRRAASVVFLARGLVRSPLAAAVAGLVPLFSAYRLTLAFDPVPLMAMIAAAVLGGLVIRAGGEQRTAAARLRPGVAAPAACRA